MEICDIVSKFFDVGNCSFEPFGEGHINRTYRVVSGVKKYILQKINNSIFTDVDALMRNIRLVTEYLNELYASRKSDETSLEIVTTLDGKDYFRDGDNYWRVYKLIDNSVCYQTVNSCEDFRQCAASFGAFAEDLRGFDASKLTEIIPDFHNTVKRFSDFKATVNADVMHRAADVGREIDFVTSRENICSRITSKLSSGEMPLRVTHNDTKLNNILFSATTGKPIAIIDLDTVMPGSICYDFGDSIRFGCNMVAEDEPDTSLVDFSFDLFETYVDGYIKSFKSITGTEKSALVDGAILMTYECGMRFLADYLNGDTYFHVSREKHNLDRCRTQFRLVEIMENNYSRLTEIVERK